MGIGERFLNLVFCAVLGLIAGVFLSMIPQPYLGWGIGVVTFFLLGAFFTADNQ